MAFQQDSLRICNPCRCPTEATFLGDLGLSRLEGEGFSFPQTLW
jgi:hypothetical protein